jgi:hypothetical protein
MYLSANAWPIIFLIIGKLHLVLSSQKYREPTSRISSKFISDRTQLRSLNFLKQKLLARTEHTNNLFKEALLSASTALIFPFSNPLALDFRARAHLLPQNIALSI